MTRISWPSTSASIRLYSRTNSDVRHLGCYGHHQRINDDLSDIFRLEKKFRFVLPSLRLKNGLHARRGCSPRIDTKHSNPIRVDFIPETVRYRSQGMLRRSKLTGIRMRLKSLTGINKSNLALPSFEHRQK